MNRWPARGAMIALVWLPMFVVYVAITVLFLPAAFYAWVASSPVTIPLGIVAFRVSRVSQRWPAVIGHHEPKSVIKRWLDKVLSGSLDLERYESRWTLLYPFLPTMVQILVVRRRNREMPRARP